METHARLRVGTRNALFTDARARPRAPWPDDVSDDVKAALHPVPAVAEAQLTFAKDQHNSGAASTCDVCLEEQDNAHAEDPSSLVPPPAVSESEEDN